MKIEVTQEHIDQGIINSLVNCPIALAIKSKGFNCRLDQLYIYIDLKDKIIYIQTPKFVANFIKDFDDGRPVSPFSFEIDNEALLGS